LRQKVSRFGDPADAGHLRGRGRITAEYGPSGHSPFATALGHHITDPGVDIRIMFGKIRDDVRLKLVAR
jgi:hypothetical protein